MSTARYVALFGGIGSGKTAAGVFACSRKIEEGYPGIMLGCDFPHFAKSLWPEMRKWLPWSRVTNGNLNHPYTQQKVLKIQTRHGIIPVYYGGIDNPSAWAGPSVGFFLLDEARRKRTRQAFDILAGRIRVGENPQGYVTTTPRASLKGQRHWLASVFQDEDFPDAVKELFAAQGQRLVASFNAPTSENEHNLDPLYLASLQALYTGRYARQELYGEFVAFEGQVFENFFETAGAWGESNVTEEADYVPGVPIEWCVDDGFTKGHPRVFLLAQTIPPYVNVFAEYVATYEVAEKSVQGTLDLGYPMPSVARVDSSAAEMIHRLWDLDIETNRGSHNVEEGVSHLRAFIRDGRNQVHLRFHPRCEFSIPELQAYCYPETVESNLSAASPRAAKPLKEADNAADALRYLVWPKTIAELMYDAGKAVTQAIEADLVSTEVESESEQPMLELVRMPSALAYQQILGRRQPPDPKNAKRSNPKKFFVPWGNGEIKLDA